MDKQHLRQYLAQLHAADDHGIAMAVRGLQALFAENGVLLDDAILHAADNVDLLRKFESLPPASALAPAKPPAVLNDLPHCRSLRPGVIEILPAGAEHGAEVSVVGDPGKDSAVIAQSMRDVLVVCVINKTTLKIKLNDMRNPKGEIYETVVQAEYARDGMVPVRIWAGGRGDAGTLAAALRKALQDALPQMLTA